MGIEKGNIALPSNLFPAQIKVPGYTRFPATEVGYDTNHTDCNRTSDNLLLNAQYYHQ